MKIAVVGLGLIGGSIAKALNKNHTVDGFDKDGIVLKAIEEGVIRKKTEDFSLYDVVLLCSPPRAALWHLKNTPFKKDGIVADFCGVKSVFEEFFKEGKNSFSYVGCHPMAGKEVSGLDASDGGLFKGASLIITPFEDTDKQSVEIIESLGKEMGFREFPKCSPKEHDRIIAYTSQLAHAVSNAYIKSGTASGFKGFTGGSFQDMTRIAALNENLWTELFLMNRENLLAETDILLENLKRFRDALYQADEERLKDLLKEGRLKKQELFKGNA